MGTQNAWGGSGGRAWGKVRNESAGHASNPSAGDAEALLPALSDAMPWLADGAEPAASAGAAETTLGPLPAGASWGAAARGRGHGGGGGSGGGSRSGGGSGGGGTRTGSGRSRARAAGVGGGVLAAGLAYQRGDAQTLATLGLDLDELRSMTSLKRANAILNAVVGADGGIEETELRHVNGRVLKQVLNNGLDGVAAVQLYVVEYVMQVWATETAEARRNGAASASASADTERQLRNALTAKARQLQVAASSTAAEIRTAIATSLNSMRRLLKGA